MCLRTTWLMLCLCACAYAQSNPTVRTSQGLVTGRWGEHGNYFTFFGLHYGGDTGGNNRFKPPTRAPRFPEGFQAIDHTIRCAQPGQQEYTENCLVLNIFTKNLITPKPVIVFIEGTDYESINPTELVFRNLVEEDLLVVTINYRLSIFGFLCLGINDAPGNVGLKDIIQGLQWIKDNIAGFGGDPNNVILLGHGSGAAMVDLITMSPMSRNLIHKAIVLSGSALSPWAVSYDPIRNAELLAEKLRYTYSSRRDLASQLASTDANKLIETISQFEIFDASLLFAPCIENDTNSNNLFITDAPINLLQSGNYRQIPYLTGFVDREGTLRGKEAIYRNWLDKMENNFENFLQVDLEFESAENKTATARSIRDFYFSNNAIDMSTIDDYLDYHGDTLTLIPVIRGAKERASTSTENIWLFKFTFIGTFLTEWLFPEILLNGARHGAILNYVIGYDLIQSDRRMSESITQRFKGFAYNGNPAPPPPQTATTWNPLTAQLTPILVISGGVGPSGFTEHKEEMSLNANNETRGFWEPIIAKHYRTPLPVISSATALFAYGLTIVVAQAFLKLLF